MNIHFLKDRTARWFIVIVSFILGAFLAAELNNGRFWLNDFKVFYLAAKALLNNEQVYGVAFGLEGGFYKYSPVTLFFFMPFQLFSFQVAAILQYIIISISTIAAILMLRQMVNEKYIEYNTKKILPLVAVFLSILILLGRELHLGNTNMILLMLIIYASKLLFEKKEITAGVVIALVILTKPYFVISFIPLLFFKQYKVIISGFITGAVLIIISFFVFGFEKGFGLYSEWMQTLFLHSSNWYVNYDIIGLLHLYFGVELKASVNIYMFFGISLILSGLIFWMHQRAQKKEVNTNDGLSWMVMNIFILVALVPSCLGTDTEHFLFSLPILAMLIFQLTVYPRPIYIAFMVILVFLFAGNSSDLIGKALSQKYDEYGVLGIVNLIFVVITIYLYTAKRKIWKN
ncbi:MAG: glycosyltransferase family 87 protein [Salinivirgaceae bacterium]